MVKNLGQLIKTTRLEQRITRIQLASMCDIGDSMLYKIEGGERMPSVRTLRAIFNCLGLTDRFEEFRWQIETGY